MTADRIDFFVPLLLGGGAERVVVDLSQEFARRGRRVRVLVGSARGELASEFQGGAKLVDFRAPRTSLAIPALARLLRSDPPDVLISFLTHANVTAVLARSLARRQTPLVLTEHNVLSEAASSGHRRDRVLPAIARRTHARAEALVSCSSGVTRDLARTLGMTPDRIATIPNPVITPGVLQGAEEDVDLQLLVPEGASLVVAAGRLVPQKGFDVLIRAVALARRHRDVRLLVLGEGPDRSDLEALVSDLGLDGVVRLHGWVDNPYVYLARADVFALSSRYEGMPNVLVSALALGTSIVATDCSSGPRELLDDGALGRLVPVEDAVEFADALLEALASPPSRVPEAAWEPYTLRRSADRYLELCDRLG